MDTRRSSRRRTGLEAAKQWSERFSSHAEAARHIRLADGEGMDPDHWRIWLRETDRRFDPSIARFVALATSLPLEAVLFKNERLCDLPCERARQAAA